MARRGPGRPKGLPKSGGRQKGTPNKITTEIKETMREFLADAQGQEALRQQYRSGTLNPSVLTLFYYYGYGKPKESIAIEGNLPPFEVVFKDDTSD